ncbi:anthranilate phosphoribosyltransferase [Bacillus solimangrovi]|uniref:Anthranilate phosphoribosyltransferase n=1 Tax=Bacillus solimangrovi TaxID=1305675 RepID=A0A1E5LH94_9BACI|nr:anthranilate phosphoribosyltransferase [Bacillus solimangrovi]OEH93448.1 anthranilate phosphoribosyltransferase [Bacillus solimangrovi]
MVKDILRKCSEGYTLSAVEAEEVMQEVMQGKVGDIELASLLSIMRIRGETANELTGFVTAMRDNMNKLSYDSPVFDTCGTGGDGASTFNISTATAIVLASLEVKVAKHGNRSVSSKSGSADVLEKIGIPLQQTEEEGIHSLEHHHMTFLFAPTYHSAMKHAANVRRTLGFRTIFNILGPLANPAGSKRQIIGVFNIHYARLMAETLLRLGSEHVLLVSSHDGLDEFSIASETDVVELKNGSIQEYTLSPEDVGLDKLSLEDTKVTSVDESVEVFEAVLKGESNEASQQILYYNAGAALYAAGRAKTIAEGVQLAKQAVQTGLTAQKLADLKGVETHA